MRRIRVLLITKIFPNSVHPDEAPFNRHQFAALSRYCDVQVLATIPWFPCAARFSKWPIGAGAPREEVIDGLPVRHPRYLYIPRIAQSLNGPLYAASLLPEIALRRAPPDVIIGAFAYPDGYAAVCLARLLGVPAVIKVHGSDIDVSPGPGARRALRWGLTHAARVVAVSQKLARGVEDLGVVRDRIDVIVNGVNRAMFRPRDRVQAKLALDRSPNNRLLLFVGHLNRDKGVLELLEAFEGLVRTHPDLELALIGDGPEERACRQAAARLGARLTVFGRRPHDEIAAWIAACDALVLPSHHEGTPNVVLEALASGRRVVATDVGGIPDVVHTDELGELVRPGDKAALAAAMSRVAYEPYDPLKIVLRCGCRSWDESARRLHEVLVRAHGGSLSPPLPPPPHSAPAGRIPGVHAAAAPAAS